MTYHVSIQPSAKTFEVAAGETVLDGARRAGLALPYSCLGGVCGSCKATVISGRCNYPNQPPQALSAAERAHGDALLCQAVPVSDLVIGAREVPSVAELPRRVLPARVISKQLLAEDVMLLGLQTPSAQPLRWLAGQYIDILLPEGRRRAFSIANAPHDGGHVELHVRRVPGGGFTQTIFSAAMPVGSLWRIEGPLGTFVPREDSERPILFMAGGTGFAPIKAIIEHFLHLGSSRPMHLYWGARQPSDLYLPDLPASWQAQHRDFRFTAVLSEPGSGADAFRLGHVHEAVLADHADLAPYDLYMSGPPPMIEAARHRFIDRGLDPDHLYYDSFEYAPDVIAAILAARAGLRVAPL